MDLNFGKLGFGFLRLPQTENGEVDLETTKQMADLYLARGFSYFDTAYIYLNGDSEAALRKTVVERYPRESFQIADKLPCGHLRKGMTAQQIFEEQLKRCGVDYFDVYLLHGLDDRIIPVQVIELDLHKVDLGVAGQDPVEHFSSVVEGKTCIADAPQRLLLLQKVKTAHLLSVSRIGGIQTVEEVDIKIVHTAPLQLLLKNLLGSHPFLQMTAGQLVRDLKRFPGIALHHGLSQCRFTVSVQIDVGGVKIGKSP